MRTTQRNFIAWYLKGKNAKLIDDKLKDIKVCDPAIGNGAFPVGMMHKIVKTKIALNPFIKENNRNT